MRRPSKTAPATAGLALLLAIPAQLQAQGAPAEVETSAEDGGDFLTLGTGVISVPSYEGADENIIIPEVVVRGKVSGFNFFSRGPAIYADVIRDEAPGRSIDVGFGPVAAVRLDRTALIKDPQVKALGKLDTAIEVGGWAGITKTGVMTSDYDLLSLRVDARWDVAGAHGSYIVTPTIEYGTPLSTKTFVGASVLAEYVGNDFGDYYFNIDPDAAAASGLSTYGEAGDGFKRAGVNLLATHALTGDLTKGLTAVAVVGYYRILGDFKRSPIVAEAGSADQFIAGLGLTYTF
ncbi:MipA/OmpV family protein [Porphyrobacter sp. TH134]|uniref:MipA/OmpV family protein n=1 Tax=Porphyrobacter sp. TH134 TaxID=2067450 RepID=UPI000C7CD3BE|nr:MipA/OmpV family protein [Porphyrobacter sp. TH134]PLK25393.1 MipA/OmpV family protein [Porphyrobacter sp. TH134]